MASERAFYVVGAGAVGIALACALRDAGWELVGLWNRGHERREQAHAVLGAAVRGGDLGPGLERARLVLVCVTDAAIPTVGARLAARGNVEPGTVVAHTAGCLPASALGALPGADLGGLHPLVAVPSGSGAEVVRNAAFGVEGGPEAIALLEKVVEALGGRAFQIPPVGKARYHAAAVMASNLIVALLHDAIAEAKAAQVNDAVSLLAQLATGAVERVQQVGARAALTGPVLRGDAATVKKHLDALGPDAARTYRAVSRRALALARERGLAAEAAAVIEQVLSHP